MNFNQVDISRVINNIKGILKAEFLSEFTINGFNYIFNLMGIIIRYPKEIFIKRLQKRRRKTLPGCIRKMRECGSKCLCCKCTKNTSKRKRVIDSDFFANLAYEHRVLKVNEKPKAKDAKIKNPCCVKEEDHRSVSIHRDVQISNGLGWSWWNNITHQRNMPPIYPPCDIATKSECSSYISGFKSNTPDVDSKESVESRKSSAATLNISNSRSVVELTVISRNTQNRSKSDPLVVLRRERIKNMQKLVRSVSTRAPSLKKKKRSRRLFNVKKRQNRLGKIRKIRASLNNLSTKVKEK